MKHQNCTDTISLQQPPALPTTQDLINKAAGHLTVAFGRLVMWQRRFEERQKLASMDARLRDDIGLTEADVDSEARKPFWQA